MPSEFGTHDTFPTGTVSVISTPSATSQISRISTFVFWGLMGIFLIGALAWVFYRYHSPAESPPRTVLKKMMSVIWLFLPSFLFAVILVALFTPFRCILEYRMSEAIATIIALLAGEIILILKAASSTNGRGLLIVSLSVLVVLLVGIIVHLVLPPLQRTDCPLAPTLISTPTPTKVLHIKQSDGFVNSSVAIGQVDGVARKNQLALTTFVVSAFPKQTILATFLLQNSCAGWIVAQPAGLSKGMGVVPMPP